MYSCIIYKISQSKVLNLYDRNIVSNMIKHPFVIRNMEDLINSQLYIGHIPFFTYFEDDNYSIFRKYSAEHFDLMFLTFDIENKKIEQENIYFLNSCIRRNTFSKPHELKNGQTVVFRDREVPNNIGLVKVIDNIPFINGIEFDDICPLRKDVRIVREGFEIKDYFLDSQTGLNNYLIDEPALKNKHSTTILKLSL